MTFADHFSALAASYATFRPHYPSALAALLAELSPARDLAWDAGCGTGQLSTALAEHFTHVIATDPSAAQLAEAEAHPRVAYRAEPAEASTLAAASAGLAVAAQAAHWFDWPRYVAEVGRVSRPGALVGIVGYGNAVVDGAAGEPFARYVQLVDAYWPPGRELVVAGYAQLAWPWPTVAAPAIAMSAAWTRDQLFGYVATWSSTARYRKAHGTAALEALAAALPDEVTQIAWPLAIKLARR